MEEYIDLSPAIEAYNHTVKEATATLLKTVKDHIQPFIYDEKKTEWYVPAGRALYYYVDNNFDFSKKELAELAENDDFKPRDISLLTTESIHKQKLVPIKSANAFVSLVEQLLAMDDNEDSNNANEDTTHDTTAEANTANHHDDDKH